MNLLNFKNFLSKYELVDKKILLAVSAGVDSMVMLDIARQVLSPLNLYVLYINHNVRSDTELDINLIEKYCKLHNLNFFCESINVPSRNFEENARKMRLELYNSYIEKYSLTGVFLGHHLDDSIETFFYNLFKGSFLTGLSGIKSYNIDFKIYRPMIDYSKVQILNYAKNNKIPFNLDYTNLDDKYSRNFIRLNLIPKISERFLGFKNNLIQKIKLFNELDNFLLKYVQKWMSENVIQKEYGSMVFKDSLYELEDFLLFKVFENLKVKCNSYNEFLDLKNKINSTGNFIEKNNKFIYFSSDHILISELDLKALNLFYFNSINVPNLKLLSEVNDVRKNNKSIFKSKRFKRIPFYFRSGAGVDLNGNVHTSDSLL